LVWFGLIQGFPVFGETFYADFKMAKSKLRNVIVLILFLVAQSCSDKEDVTVSLSVESILIGTYSLNPVNQSLNQSAPFNQPITIEFSRPVKTADAVAGITLRQNGDDLPITVSFKDENSVAVVSPASNLEPATEYFLHINKSVSGSSGEQLAADLAIGFKTSAVPLTLESLELNGVDLLAVPRIDNADPNHILLELSFSSPVDFESLNGNTIRMSGTGSVSLEFAALNENIIAVTATEPLADWTRFQIQITDGLRSLNGEAAQPLTKTFYTGDNEIPDHPVISDEALLTLVQQQTFKYFWDFGHPASGMARERNTSGNLVTSGGSGFGLMAIIVGIERGFITRAEGLERLEKIVTFLEGADRFHGAWSHWIDGNTGDVLPFSANDNGGDLVETALLLQGLITFRQYLNSSDGAESGLIDRINTLWEGVEWDWYTREDQKVLYWHWSPDKQWTMNHQIRGHNETLITYILAASSPTHPISKEVYTEGYARNGAMRNGKEFYGNTLPLGEDYGGPLFFAHYSFLGLDPRDLQDAWANYWTQNRNHTLINRAYVVDNPRNYIGYNEQSWGLTASDNNNGYSAHSPNNDLGVITPTAALSSFPYTPEESMAALKFFYYSIGDRLWGEYGFYDSYNLTAGWVADSYLAIDQGPIIVMIENHRTGLLWDLFMTAPEIQNGLTTLGFTY
jgi:hypothetical protein